MFRQLIMCLIKIIACYSLLFIFVCSGIGQTVNQVSLQSSNVTLGDGDSTVKLQVRKIIVTGNDKTKTYVILREIQFKEGDSIIVRDLLNELLKAKEQVYNTTLFNEVSVKPVIISAYQVDIKVDVKERWYIYPSPIFKLIDRNLNVWLHTYEGSLERVDYGIKFDHFNLTGNKDALRLNFMTGYNKNISFSYTEPYVNSSLNAGIGVNGGYVLGREVFYGTSYGNKTLNFDNDNYANKTLGGSFTYFLRRGIKVRESWSVGYNYVYVIDSVLVYNPNYFNNKSTTQNIIDLSYSYRYVDLDNVTYPLKGRFYSFDIVKRGLGFTGGLNMLSVDGNYKKYWQLANNLYADINLYGNIKLPFYQAYINQNGLGYGENYLRGLQYYVVDGVISGYVRSTLRTKLLGFKTPFPIKSKTHKFLPFNFYAKAIADFGGVYNKPEFPTFLNNKLLYTEGVGLDMVTLYDFTVGLEYCFNQLHQNGLFLHLQSGF